MSGVGIAIGVIFGLILLIWVSAEFKRAKHKVLAIVLVGVILFVYFSASSVFKDKNVDFKSVKGVTNAFQIYFSWIGTTVSNVKSFTANAINWQNKSS